MANEVKPAEAPASTSTPHDLLRMFHPETQKYVSFPPASVEKAKARGYEPAWQPWESALAGAGQGVTLGFGDELTGAAKAGAQAIGDGSLEGFGEHYKQNRDDARDSLAAARGQNPKAYLAGEVVGSLPAVAVAPESIAGQVAGAAVQGLGHSDAASAKDLAADAAEGAAGGAIGAGVGKLVGAGFQAAKPGLKNLAGKALLSGAGIGAHDLGVAGKQQAVEVAKHALEEPGVVPNVFSRAGSGPENLAENAHKAAGVAGKAMEDLHGAFDAAHGPTIDARELAKQIQGTTSEAVRVKPEMTRHVMRAIRQIDPEAFDEKLSALVKARHVAGLRVHRLVEAAKEDATVTPQIIARVKRAKQEADSALTAFKADPTLAYPPGHMLGHTEAQKVVNRIRELGAYPSGALPTAAELTVKKDVLSPAWDTGVVAIKNSAEAHGGPEAVAAEEAARSRYALNKKMEQGAQKAAVKQSRATQGVIPQGVAAAGRAAAGTLIGGSGAGAALAFGAPTLEHVVVPRVAKTLHNAATSHLPEHTGKLLSTYGGLFKSHTPERRTALDHRLQELSPRYRELRKKASDEVANHEKSK